MQKLLLTMLLSLLIPLTAIAQEAYAVYNKSKRCSILALTLFFFLRIWGYDYTDNQGINYTYINSTTCYVDMSTTSIKSSTARITIPSKVNGRSVVKIGKSAFFYSHELVSLTIPQTVTEIDEKAIEGCDNITTIALPNSIVSIGEDAFFGCTSLKSITLSSNLKTISDFAFYDCEALTSIVIPASVTSIGAYSFMGCGALTSIKVETGNTVYDSRNNCNALIKTATNELIRGCVNTIIPNTVKTLSSYAFGSCTGLTSIYIPSSVTSLGGFTFHNCINLKTMKVDINNPIFDSRDGCNAVVRKSTNQIIAGCGGTSFPQSITGISNFAFYGCRALTTLTLPENIKNIDNNAFGWCTNLKELTLKNRSITIGKEAFYSCEALRTINSYIPDPTDINEDVFLIYKSSYSTEDKSEDVYNYATLYVPIGSKKLYQERNGWKKFKRIVEKFEVEETNPIKDHNLIESEDELQKRLDEIAAEKPTNPVTLTIQDKGITIENTIVAEIGCKAIITGGKITVSKNFTFRRNYVRNCIFDNHGELTFQAITIDGNSIFFENAFFSNSFGTLTIGENVSYENIYQGELRYGFYLSTGTLKVYSGNLSLNGPIFYPTHGGKVYIYGGEFRTFNEKNIVSGDDAMTIWGGKFSGGPIGIANLTIADMELGIIPELNVSSIYANNIYINRVLKLPIINIGKNGMITLNWHYRVWYPQMNYQGKWKIYSDWTEMELEKPFVVSGYEKYPVTQNDFNNMEFIDMPDDREAYYDEQTKTVKLRNKATVLPTTGCDEEWLQKKLDEIAAQKPTEPVELTICPDGLTLTKSIHVDRDCKAIITGGPITSAASIEYRYGQEGLFMVYGELGFKDISLNLTNDSKSDGCLGYFWLGDGKLQLGKGASVVTTNGTVVGGWGDLEVTDAVIQAGGEELVIADKVNAAVTEYVFLVGEKTYCNGKLSIDMKTDANTGNVKFPIFRVGQIYISTSLDLWAPKNMLQQLYLHKDATIKTYTDAFVQLPLTGEWDQMTLGRAFITSPSITLEDYSRMTFSGMPTNRRAEFVANSHQVRLMSASQLSIQTQLAVLNNSSAAAAVTLNLPPEAVTVVNQSATVNHKNVTFSGMQSGSGSRGRLHFADGQTLTITSGSSLTLTDIDVTGEGSNNGFIVNGKVVIGENVHVSDLPCLLHVGSSGRIFLSAQPVSVVTMEFIGGIANGQTIVAGSDGYQLTASDLEYIQVEGCELQLDEANNRIIAVNTIGIESIAADTEAKDGAGEYYDLSGRRVATPRHGAYILLKGGKTRKTYIK